jgi:hypothetical protein
MPWILCQDPISIEILRPREFDIPGLMKMFEEHNIPALALGFDVKHTLWSVPHQNRGLPRNARTRVSVRNISSFMATRMEAN